MSLNISYFMRTLLATLSILLGLFAAYPTQAVTLEKIISQENQSFGINNARMSVGRDGKVYLVGTGGDPSYALRLNRDGSEKIGGYIGHAARFCTASSDGIIASVNTHFDHAIRTYTADFKALWSQNDFPASDALGFSSPDHVEAGTSGNFYVADQYRDRITEFLPNGNILQIYAIPRFPGNPKWDIKRCDIKDFRVCEKTKTFAILYASFPEGDTIACVGFDGKVRWRTKETVAFVDFYNSGGFDLDEDGNLYVITNLGDTISKYAPDGTILAPIKLAMGDVKPAFHVIDNIGYDFITDIRVFGNEVVLRRFSKTELFQCYDMTNGKQLAVVNADNNHLKVVYPSEVWTAGQPLPFTISFDTGGAKIAPHWRVWARPLAGGAYKELAWKDDLLQVPNDFAGLYSMKVSPEVQPVLRGTAAEYQVRATVEVRQPGSKGTVNVLTPNNRLYYGRGETVPFTILLRTADADMPTTLTVRLLQGSNLLAEKAVTVAGAKEITLTLPNTLTAMLAPGNYQLTATAPAMTCISQTLTIGPGLAADTFHFLQYGDYGDNYPSNISAVDVPDRVSAFLENTRKTGWNMVVDRLGYSTTALNNKTMLNELNSVIQRLQQDPLAVAADKAYLDSSAAQCLAGYGALGIRYMSILMSNDAGLPILPKESTPGFDHRSLEQVMTDLTNLQASLTPFTAFRGWSWSSNWWIYENTGSKAARTPQEKAAYEAAFKEAKASGKWNPVLDTVADIRLGYAAEFQELFNSTIAKLTPGKKYVTASAGPYRNVESYPPISLSNIQETDLQAQWEQLPPAFYAPHNVDFYQRPGKKAFSHPEVWNDNGSGDIMLTMLMSQVMRGANGVGISGKIHPWGQQPEDSRSGYNGLYSAYRAFSETLKPYGPWLETLKTHDQVAIIADGRMFKTEEWAWIMGRQFYRVLEAYASCLTAHYPASIIFPEDLQPDTLKAFKAVIVVSQRVEMEPALSAALQEAKNAGVTIFADSLCRPELVKDFTPLNLSFNHFENNKNQAGSDYTMASLLADCRLNTPSLAKALSAVATPSAEVASDQIWLSERTAGKGRYLFVVNNTIPTQEPGQLWRIDLAIANRLPVIAPITLNAQGATVYDLLAMKEVIAKNDIVQADLRYFPARIYAILPTAIAGVTVKGPGPLIAGQSFNWSAAVQDIAGKPIPASLPVRVRLIDEKNVILEEQFVMVNATEASGSMTTPVNLPDGTLTLEVTELCSGKTARLVCKISPATFPMVISTEPTVYRSSAPLAATKIVIGKISTPDAITAEMRFGPHIRDLVLTGDGTTAVMNTFNWDNNLYALDTTTGKLRWNKRLGEYFTFAPIALRNGFAVQGFSFTATEGYRLFQCDNTGNVQRGFGSYGIMRRMIQRFLPNQLNDRMNSFAMPLDGAWVASAADLGVAVWKADGTLCWKEDLWKTNRTTPTLQGVDIWTKARLHTPLVTALDSTTLLVTDGMQATAYEAISGKLRWQLSLGSTGEISQVSVSRDGSACALLTDANSGTIFLLQQGKLAATLPAHNADTIALAPDGNAVAMTGDNLLKYYTQDGGLQWSFAGEQTVHYPRFSSNGKRLAICSSLGTLYILNTDGTVVLERDMDALAIPAWLPNGDLLLGTWEGVACRLAGTTWQERWHTLLRPATQETNSPSADQGKPITRISSFGNALPTPLPITDNLLTKLNPSPFIYFYANRPGNPENLNPQNDTKLLIDGKEESPEKPWLDWGTVALFAEQYPMSYIEINAYVTQLQVTGITLLEDPQHPESWLHDIYLEYWDQEKEQWIYVQHLLSDTAIHSHQLAEPVTSSRFRLVLPWGCCGNVRLGEIVLHGKVLGHSNADVRAGNARTVLFDGQNTITRAIYGNYQLTFDDSYSGKAYLTVGDEKNGGYFNVAVSHPTVSYLFPDWYVPITEQPQPGEYRYLQFAWKAQSPNTTGMALCLNGNTYTVCAGTGTAYPGSAFVKVADTVPTIWTTVIVDLWEAFGKRPFRMNYLSFSSQGGKAGLAQVVLGRTKEDLPTPAR